MVRSVLLSQRSLVVHFAFRLQRKLPMDRTIFSQRGLSVQLALLSKRSLFSLLLKELLIPVPLLVQELRVLAQLFWRGPL